MRATLLPVHNPGFCRTCWRQWHNHWWGRGIHQRRRAREAEGYKKSILITAALYVQLCLALTNAWPWNWMRKPPPSSTLRRGARSRGRGPGPALGRQTARGWRRGRGRTARPELQKDPDGGEPGRERQRKRPVVQQQESIMLPVSHYTGSPEDPLGIPLVYALTPGRSWGDPQRILRGSSRDPL